MPCTWKIEADLENAYVELVITDAVDGRAYTVHLPTTEARRFGDLVHEIADTVDAYVFGADAEKAEILRLKARQLQDEADRLSPRPKRGLFGVKS